jgi:tetratricopeptide (TPR) repeat protein
MNKLAIVALGLCLSACAKEPDMRPDPYIKSEALLQQGIIAYEQDNFSEATQKFSRALVLYQSFDNHHGIALTRLNLVETALASSDFANAQLYLQQLKQQAANSDLEANLKRKIIFLEVKLLSEQQQYQAALATLQPLLAESAKQQKPDAEQLNLLAMQAKLEVLIAPSVQSQGLTKFEAALKQLEPQSPHYQTLLNRILATIALKRADYQTAISLLTQALDYYKTQAQRRSTASCLEELADVETARKNKPAAQDYLQRALVIREWLKNDFKSQKIRQQLATDKKH